MSLLTCACFVLAYVPSVFADNTATEATASTEATVETASEELQPKVYTLTLQEAIDMAREKDPGYMSADVKIKDAEKQLEQARRNKKDMEGVPIRVSQGLTYFALQRGYYVKQAEIGIESAKKEKEQTIAKNAYSITQQYYNVKLAERLLNSAESAYELAKTNLETIESRFSLGMVAELDVNNAAYSVNQAKSVCDKYERNLDIATKSLAVALFIEDDEYVLNLTDDIEFVDFSANCDEDIAKAMETRYDIFALKSAVSQAEFMLDISDLYGGTSAEYSSANQSKVQSEVTYNLTKKLIGVSIYSSYNAILDAKDSIALAQENLELRQKEYDVATVQSGLGMMTNTQLTAAMNSVTNAKIELDNAKLTYKLAVEKYGYEIAIGL